MATLLLHCYVECPSIGAGTHVAAQLAERLELLAPVSRVEVAPYWKIEAYIGVTVRFDPGAHLSDVFGALVQRVEEGWTFIDDESHREAIWNSGGADAFLHGAVRWAQVQYDK